MPLACTGVAWSQNASLVVAEGSDIPVGIAAA